jgi:hypothetical protein
MFRSSCILVKQYRRNVVKVEEGVLDLYNIVTYEYILVHALAVTRYKNPINQVSSSNPVYRHCTQVTLHYPVLWQESLISIASYHAGNRTRNLRNMKYELQSLSRDVRQRNEKLKSKAIPVIGRGSL